MSLDVAVVRQLRPADRVSWDRLARDRTLYVSSGWLASMSGFPGVVCEFVLVHDSGKLVGAMPTYTDSHRLMRRYDPAAIFADIPGDWSGTWVIAGAASGHENGILIDGALSVDERSSVLSTLDDALRKRVRQENARGAVYCFATDAQAAEWNRLDPDIVPVPQRPTAHITLTGDTFEEYLSVALSRQRREAVKREIRKYAAAGYETRIENLETCLSEIVELLLAVEDKHGHRLDPSTVEASLQHQARELPESFAITARSAGRMVAVSSCCVWGERLYVRAIGLRYPELRDAFEYFNLCFYEPMRVAYANRLSGVSLGLGTYSPKIARGARLVRRSAIVRHGPQPEAAAAQLSGRKLIDSLALDEHGRNVWEGS